MELAQVISTILIPAMAELPQKMSSDEASVVLLTIGQQESNFEHRYQVLSGGRKGPARSFWQGEETGGMVKGVMTHPATKDLAQKLYIAHGVAPNTRAVWQAIETDDILACALARLLLWSDPYPLPKLGDINAAWDLYAERTWRPGKPHPETWPAYYRAAMVALGLS